MTEERETSQEGSFDPPAPKAVKGGWIGNIHVEVGTVTPILIYILSGTIEREQRRFLVSKALFIVRKRNTHGVFHSPQLASNL